MAGPLTIQRVPRGLLDALALRATGQGPTEVNPALQGTFDASRLYLQEVVTGQTQFVNPLVNNWNLAQTVPSGEIWLMVNISAQVTAGAGTINFTPGYMRRPGSLYHAVHPGSWYSLASGLSMLAGGLCEGLVLSPGDQVGVFCRAVTGADSAFVNTDYYRLRW